MKLSKSVWFSDDFSTLSDNFREGIEVNYLLYLLNNGREIWNPKCLNGKKKKDMMILKITIDKFIVNSI